QSITPSATRFRRAATRGFAPSFGLLHTPNRSVRIPAEAGPTSNGGLDTRSASPARTQSWGGDCGTNRFRHLDRLGSCPAGVRAARARRTRRPALSRLPRRVAAQPDGILAAGREPLRPDRERADPGKERLSRLGSGALVRAAGHEAQEVP